MMRRHLLWVALAAVAAAGYALTWLLAADYYFYAGYTVLQFAVLAIAWNILGGYGGYVNFGTAGFFGVGAYTAVALHKLIGAPLPLLILYGAALAGMLGCLMGLITLRLKGMYFAIATMALAVLLETAVTNWGYVGGARGAYTFPPLTVPGFQTYVKFLFIVMLVTTLIAIAISATIERSRVGRKLLALKDSEEAAEACGVSTLTTKVLAAGMSSALMGAAGAILPFYLTFVDPQTAFGMTYSISAVAMAMIGGTGSWVGPLLGAILLGTVHQLTTVTISSEAGILVLGLALMVFVALAPRGIVGWLQALTRAGRG
jgi:branched-chain amino acid transport system permease protein